VTVLTAFADANDGYLESQHGTYANARSGSGATITADVAGTDLTVGQAFLFSTYFLYEAFVKFDTSSITASGTISTAVLSLYGTSDTSTTDFTMEAWINNWTAALDSTDWVAGASISALTKVATFATAGFSTSGYNAFTDVAMPANVNKTGTTSLMVASSRLAAGTAPGGREDVTVGATDRAGTTNDPKLVVTYTLASKFPPSVNVNQAVMRAAVR
jgi:uncharacterized membrane protein